MKVIDLLNKIANGEEVPEKFRFAGQKFEKQGSYIEDEDGDSIFASMCTDFSNINDEVEVIEEDKIIVEDKEGNKKEYFIKLNGGLKEGEKIFKQDNEWYVQKLVPPESEFYKWIEQFKPEIYYTLEDKTIEEDKKIEKLEIKSLDEEYDLQYQIEIVHYENVMIANAVNEIIDRINNAN